MNSKLNSAKAAQLALQAGKYRDEKDYENAIKCCEEGLALDPTERDCWYELCRVDPAYFPPSPPQNRT